MDGISWVTRVHGLALNHPIILHAIIKRVWIYFNAYGITHTHMAKYRIDDIIAGKIAPEKAFEEIVEKYSREVKNAPKKKEG